MAKWVVIKTAWHLTHTTQLYERCGTQRFWAQGWHRLWGHSILELMVECAGNGEWHGSRGGGVPMALWPGRRRCVSWVREQTLFWRWEGLGRRAPTGSRAVPPVHGKEMAFLLLYQGHSQVPLIWCCILSLLSFQGHFPFNWDHGVIYASYKRLESTIRSKVPI